MIERTTVRLPQELLRRAKRQAAVEGRTLTSLIADGLRLILAEGAQVSKTTRVMPRISKAGRARAPSSDLPDFKTVQEMDDRDYVERMKHLE
jgi:hypothetical protein